MALMRRNPTIQDRANRAMAQMNRGSREFMVGARKRGQVVAARSGAMMSDAQRKAKRHPMATAGIFAAIAALIGFLLYRRNR